jgi:hypothetical protein
MAMRPDCLRISFCATGKYTHSHLYGRLGNYCIFYYKIAQADHESIPFIITEDASTLYERYAAIAPW